MTKPDSYYVPHGSPWPIIGALGLACLVLGAAELLTGAGLGGVLLGIGILIILAMIIGWFRTVIQENESGAYNSQVDRSFRWGMGWFIFSEAMLFAAFFGALFYARALAVPWLGGAGEEAMTHSLLWPDFTANWPLLQAPSPQDFTQPSGILSAWGIPAFNTLVLLLSSVTVTWAHWGLIRNERRRLIIGLILTVALAILFLSLQAREYIHAYTELNLKLSSGIYGTTFFMLTGFHGMHVTIGTIMLLVMLGRSLLGHFTPDNHFAFQAAAWYWHFVDVVWLCLFTFVYWF